MVYDLSNSLATMQFRTRAEKLMSKGCIVELTEKSYRSGNQNRYLHALLGAVVLETGNSLEYIKTEYYKRRLNPDIFAIKSQDKFFGEVETLRSSASLTTEEMSLSIDRLKKWAAEEGIYLPEPGDEELLKQIEYEMQRNKRYL